MWGFAKKPCPWPPILTQKPDVPKGQVRDPIRQAQNSNARRRSRVSVGRETVEQSGPAGWCELFQAATLRSMDRVPGVHARVASESIGMAEHRLRIGVADRPVLAGVRVLRAVLVTPRQH